MDKWKERLLLTRMRLLTKRQLKQQHKRAQKLPGLILLIVSACKRTEKIEIKIYKSYASQSLLICLEMTCTIISNAFFPDSESSVPKLLIRSLSAEFNLEANTVNSTIVKSRESL